jgi:uncharacterized membrane protein
MFSVPRNRRNCDEKTVIFVSSVFRGIFFCSKMSTPDRQERIGKGVFHASFVSSNVFHKASTSTLDTTIPNVVVGIQVSVLNFIAVFFLLREGVLIHPVVCYLAEGGQGEALLGR